MPRTPHYGWKTGQPSPEKPVQTKKPKYQEVINLRYFQELSYKEISEHIGEPMNNVKVKLLRAKKLLADIIQKTE